MANTGGSAKTATELILWCAAISILFLLYMMSRPKLRSPKPLKLRESPDESKPREKRVKELNVIFSYNGHDFDAYEALGLPAGASPESVKQAYDAALQKADPDSHDFLNRAYQSIVRK